MSLKKETEENNKLNIIKYALSGDSNDYLEVDPELMTQSLKLVYMILPENCRRKELDGFYLNSDQIFVIVSCLKTRNYFLAGQICQICEVVNCLNRQKMPGLFNH